MATSNNYCVECSIREAASHRTEIFHPDPLYCRAPVEYIRGKVRLKTRAANDPLVFTISEKAPTRAFSWF